jgi:type II secretory pathway component PulK
MSIGGAHIDIRRNGEEGVALILVLMLILLLSVVVAEFSYEAQVEASLSGGHGNEFSAYIAAKSAVAAGFAALHSDLLMGQADQMQRQGSKIAQSIANKDKTGSQEQLEQYDGCTDAWYYHEPMPDLNGAGGNFWISDECGKLNLNAIVDSQGKVNDLMVETLKILFRNMQADETAVDAIVEHILPGASTLAGGDTANTDTGTNKDTKTDANEHTNANANADQQMYDPRNLFNSVEELLFVPGITPEMYFDLNQPQQEQESGLFGDQAQPSLSLSDLLTVHGDPSGAFNVNTVQAPLLEALMEASGVGSPGDAQQMVSDLRMEPARSTQELAERFGLDAQQLKSVQCKSNFYRIQGDGWVENTMVRIETFVFRNEEQIMASMDQYGLSSSGNYQNKKQGQQQSKSSFNTSNSANSMATPEAFKILDWRVIR